MYEYVERSRPTVLIIVKFLWKSVEFSGYFESSGS
jgi:hypothetical protein